MSATICAVETCDRPLTDGYVCTHCAWSLEKSLGDVTWLVEQLDVVLTRQTATGERIGSRGSETALPYDPRATEARWVLGNTITGWARVVAEESPGAHLPSVPLGGHIGLVAIWLGTYAEWLRHHPAGNEAVEEITSAVNAARRLVDVRPERWYAGPCGGTEDNPCGHDLYARPGKAEIRCPSCSARYDATARREWLIEAANDHLATAAECSALCRAMLGDLVSRDMIDGYVRRGKLASHGSGLDRKGRTVKMFRIGDVIAAATAAKFDVREQRASRRAGRTA